jgi:hypothetical protein
MSIRLLTLSCDWIFWIRGNNNKIASTKRVKKFFGFVIFLKIKIPTLGRNSDNKNYTINILNLFHPGF